MFHSKHLSLRTKVASFKYKGIALDIKLFCRLNLCVHPHRRTMTSEPPLFSVDEDEPEQKTTPCVAASVHPPPACVCPPPPVCVNPSTDPDVVDLTMMRISYRTLKEAFLESDLVAREPIEQFKHWFEEASNHPHIPEPNAMALATSTMDGKPSCRMVLLKGFGPGGFRFFTNYEGRKAQEIAENPLASLMFYWEAMNRSVRIEGKIQLLSAEDSAEYFHKRPLGSQVAACVSRQSTVIPNRDYLLDRADKLMAHAQHKTLPKPPFWGGYVVIPDVVEFWQGQTNRLHDRIRFRRRMPQEKIDEKLTHVGDDGWVFERLAP